ncbi:glycosyltransferase family 4 protein [Baekduia soli]|uniref:Glycosyltransferase family 4 protein n=1 Tax=Baekduia soli TaxID=496014 RepID=A0A5B8TZV8_9ACTN|nr:glycosyltransferase family 1 protein [Baekduia soli]QEC46261.1 glycosyltransferase family 4 protein [Baekduia soli]
MRIGVNGLHLTEGGGGAVRYASELLRAICEADHGLDITMFISRDAPAELRDAVWASAVRWVQLPVAAHGAPNALLQAGGMLPLALAHRVGVMHSLAGVGPPRVPGAMASVVTLLDLIWLLLPDQVSMSAAERASWIRWTRFATQRATRVIAISHAGAADIARSYGIAPERIDVTPLGVRAVALAAPTPEPELRDRLALGAGPVLLSVGQQQPYKAQDQLIRALAQLGRRDVVLALPGPPTDYGGELARLAAGLGVGDRVRLLGFVSDADVEGLFAVATAVLQPSRMEGFGLPALEAMQRGRPLACSGRSALGEVVGDAALLVDPDDVGSIAAAMGRLLDDEALRDDLGRRGPARASEFTWEATAQATVESYRRALHAARS